MDSDDEEMLAALLDEEVDSAAADDEEHLMMLASLVGLYDADAQPKRGGSAPGRRKSKARQRTEIMDCLPCKASGDPRPSSSSAIAARSGGAPVDAQMRGLGLYNLFEKTWFKIYDLLNYL